MFRCSWSQPWAFRSWAPLSQEPRRFCGRKPVSPSRPGPPRWKASSRASPSLAWCWMSKVPKARGHSRLSAQYNPSQSLFFFFFFLFRWENLWQGPCGDHARERGEAEPTVGDRTAVTDYLRITLETRAAAAGDTSVMEGSFLNFCKAVNEVTGEPKRTTRHFTFLLASALVRKSDVEELAKKVAAAPRSAPVTVLPASTGKTNDILNSCM